MKSVKDIELMTSEYLEKISLDEAVEVPEGLTARVEAGVRTALFRKRLVRTTGVAAAVAVMAVAGFGIAGFSDEPVDTFDDPYLAYAEVEKAFARMSEGMKKGMDMAGESEEILNRTIEILK